MDDLKISHYITFDFNQVLNWIHIIMGYINTTCGKKHNYIGMVLYWLTSVEVKYIWCPTLRIPYNIYTWIL